MSNWIFFAGKEGAGLNDGRRIIAYDTGTLLTIDSTISQSQSINSWSTFGITGDNLMFAPHPLIPQQYDTLQGVPLDSIGNVSIVDNPFSYRFFSVVINNGTVYCLGTDGYLNGIASRSISVCRVNDNNTITFLKTSLSTSTLPVQLVSNNTSLYYFVNVSDTLKYYISTNGVSWDLETTGVSLTLVSPSAPILSSMTATFGISLTAFSTIKGGFTANGGSSWTAIANFPNIGLSSIDYVLATSTGVYAIVGSRIYGSTNGTTWNDLGEPLLGENIYNIAYGNSQYMIVGAVGTAATTTDFVTYTPFSAVNFTLNDVYGAIYTTASVYAEPPVGGGTGVITGTLRLDTSTGEFAARKVYLYNYITGVKIDETTSDAITGTWQFTQVAAGSYFVVGVAESADLNIPRDFDALGVITIS